VCDVCTLKMDHHCPWINNCVGYQNHRHFALFIIWCTIGPLYITLLNLVIFTNPNLKNYTSLTSNWYLLLVSINIALSIVLGSFTIWTWYLIIQGKTTIEFWKDLKENKNDLNQKSSYENL